MPSPSFLHLIFKVDVLENYSMLIDDSGNISSFVPGGVATELVERNLRRGSGVGRVVGPSADASMNIIVPHQIRKK